MKINHVTFFSVIILAFLMQKVGAQQIYYNKALHGSVSEKKDSEIKGNPYLEDNFSKYAVEGANIENIPLLRYNHYSDQMEYLDEDVLYNLNKIPNMLITLKKSNKQFVYLQYQENDGKSGGYLQILTKGKNTILYKKENVTLVEKVEKGDLMDTAGTKVKVYERYLPFYYFNIDNSVVPVSKKKSEFVSLFKDNRIKEYIKNEKISSTKELDLIKLTEFINSL